MRRREFLKLIGSWAGMAMLGCAPPKPHGEDGEDPSLQEKGQLEGMLIMDAHAHPDQFYTLSPRQRDSSSTVASMAAVGMTASSFSALGDSQYRGSSLALTSREVLEQLDRVKGLEQRGKLRVVTRSSEIAGLLRERRLPGAILAIEGGDPLEWNPDRVNEFYKYGVRMITLVHYRINELGDIMTAAPKHHGLTSAGRKVVERMQDLGMVVDAAHASEKTLSDILEVSERPIIDSHTSPCPGDETDRCGRLRAWRGMEQIARKGGLICTWPLAMKRKDFSRQTVAEWAQEIRTMKERLGIEHVGLGTDGGGNLPALVQGYRDVRDLSRLAGAMAAEGLSREDTAAYMGGNLHRVLKKCMG